MPTIFNSNPNIAAMTIFLRTLQNRTLSIRVESTATVYELKDFIYRKYRIPIQSQQLFYHGRLLKNKRNLSTYKIDEKSTITQPVLLQNIFNVQIFVSKKVLSLYSLTNKKKLSSQKTIQCNHATTINSILKQLNLSHLSHLLKICAGAGTKDIKDMNKKIRDIPHLLNDGILSILFSARWFLNRILDITTFNSWISQTVQSSTESTKLLKSCISFNRLDYQFQKTQTLILTKFGEIDEKLKEQSHEIKKAEKWLKNIIQKNNGIQIDDDSQRLLNQLQTKIGDIDNNLSSVLRRWNRKQTKIVLYLKQIVRKAEIELMTSFKLWITMDVVQWLQYMDDRIIFNDDILKQFQTANINGYNLSDINDLSLKLMGIKDIAMRELIIGYIEQLLIKYGNKTSCGLPYCCSSQSDSDSNSNYCCICVTNEVNTVIVPCGHATYCIDCSKKSIKHYFNHCPICRQKITSIIPFYKAGLQFSQN